MIVFDPSKSDEEIKDDIKNLQKELIAILKANKAKNEQIKEYIGQAEEAGRSIELYMDEEIEDRDLVIHVLQQELFE